ncbi:MAG: 5-formyltetrahydrofolate cyclo-ligase [Actinomycetota bacterium]|nr:5-formyltetrahydrofolate cyclo-ligase [Actinomycetota bacterium]
MSSSAIRAQMLKGRETLPPERVALSSAQVVERIRNLSAYAASSLVGSYIGTRGEIDPAGLLEGPGPEIALPVVMKDQPLQFVVPDGPLAPGPFGIRQPVTGRPVDPIDLDVVLVPLVAVDPSGNRVGHGAGYYDRTFAFRQGSSRPILIGLAHHFQLVEHLQPNPWDIPLDLIVTEIGVLRSGIAPSTASMGED